MKSLLYLFLGSLGIWGFISLGNPFANSNQNSDLPDQIDYNFHIRPILSDKCFACHGPDANNQEAGLRLDKAEFALEELPESPGKFAWIPKNPSKSEALIRMQSEDPTVQMPPPESHLSLTAGEIALIEAWVEQGATYKEHWAFIPPKPPVLPENANKASGIHGVDYLIQRKLEEVGLDPSPPAKLETLARRASFSLTGLPPKQEWVEALSYGYLSYEALIDSLLISPSYGEHMAAYWMDVARYADSDGYLDDKHRDFSPYRDWVIEAFNRNMPYKDFVSWQIAGDLLPGASQDQKLATAFNRLHRKNSEAGIVFEEYRVEYVADKTNTFGKAFLALSMECARCHDHKYDPISQEEYFKLFGFFNSTSEIGHAVYGPDQTPGPALLLEDREVKEKRLFLEKEIEKLEEERGEEKGKSSNKPWSVESQKSEKIAINSLKYSIQDALVAHYSFDQVSKVKGDTWTSPEQLRKEKPATLVRPVMGKGKKGKAFYITDYNSGKLGEKVGWYDRTDPFSLDFWVYVDTLYPEAGILTHCEDLRLGYKGYSLHVKNNRLTAIMAHSWPQNSIQVTTLDSLVTKQWTHIGLTYSGNSKAEGLTLFINGQKAEVEVEQDHLYKGILFEYNIHTYGFSGIQFGQRGKITPLKGGAIDEIKVYNRELSPLEVLYTYSTQGYSMEMGKLAQQERTRLFQEHVNLLNENQHPSTTKLRTLRDSLNLLVNEIPEIMVMGDLPEKRPTYILDRGAYDSPTQEVEPGTPEAVLPFSDQHTQDRAGLVSWLFDPDNPLTARVMANRMWYMHFGRGLVKTTEDLGNQGDLPSHPELLDYLARYFIESGWDIKALHKHIMLSATYQQASVISPDLQEKDPENMWLARGPRIRMSAEMIRDNALSISGLLVDEIGGPSVYPYQPEGLWDEISNKHWRYKYLQEPGDGLYRRSLYSVWKRTSPPPSMQIFDVGERGTCRVRRRHTMTPLQALVLLNDPQYQEAARALAEQMYEEFPHSSEAQLVNSFMRVLGRNPDPNERQMLQDFYKKEWEKFNQRPAKADDYLCNGEREVQLARVEPVQLASLGVVINGLMNTDEAVTRN